LLLMFENHIPTGIETRLRLNITKYNSTSTRKIFIAGL
jgi:hypothetical protein